MKTCTRCGEKKDVTLFGSNGTRTRSRCRECERQIDRERWKDPTHKAKRLARNKAWALSNAEMVAQQKAERYRLYIEEERRKGRVRSAQYYADNRDLKLAKLAVWRDENREVVRAKVRRWNSENKDVLSAHAAKRRAAKLNATPGWLTQADLKMIKTEYSLAAWCSEVMGTEYHVDHIIPLLGKTVCGLHVPWNLQVIPANDNLRKSNKLVAA